MYATLLGVATPVRTNGDYEAFGVPGTWWPSGRQDSHSNGPNPSQVWLTGGRQGSLMPGGDTSGTFSYGDFGVGAGYGRIGPGGPSRGNVPGFMPAMWWNTFGDMDGGKWPPALTRASEIVINGVVCTPMGFQRNDDTVRVAAPAWFTNPMLMSDVSGPNAAPTPATLRRDGYSFWSSVVSDALLWGRGCFVYGFDRDGEGNAPKPGTFELVRPVDVQVDHEKNRFVLFPGDDGARIVCDFDGEFTLGGQRRRLVVLRGLPPHHADPLAVDMWGGVIPRHMHALGLLNNLDDYADGAFASHVPAGILKSTDPAMTQSEAQDLRAGWERAHQDGSGIAVLNSVTEFAAINRQPLKDMAMDVMAKWTLTEIAHAFRMSASWLDQDTGGSLTYATLTDQRQDLVAQTLQPVGTMLEELLTAMLPFGTRAKVRWGHFTTPSMKDRLDTYLPMLQAGAITVEEFRVHMGLPPIAGDAVDDLDDRR